MATLSLGAIEGRAFYAKLKCPLNEFRLNFVGTEVICPLLKMSAADGCTIWKRKAGLEA
jgi:hypothetical protein